MTLIRQIHGAAALVVGPHNLSLAMLLDRTFIRDSRFSMLQALSATQADQLWSPFPGQRWPIGPHWPRAPLAADHRTRFAGIARQRAH